MRRWAPMRTTRMEERRAQTSAISSWMKKTARAGLQDQGDLQADEARTQTDVLRWLPCVRCPACSVYPPSRKFAIVKRPALHEDLSSNPAESQTQRAGFGGERKFATCGVFWGKSARIVQIRVLCGMCTSDGMFFFCGLVRFLQ